MGLEEFVRLVDEYGSFLEAQRVYDYRIAKDYKVSKEKEKAWARKYPRHFRRSYKQDEDK